MLSQIVAVFQYSSPSEVLLRPPSPAPAALCIPSVVFLWMRLGLFVWAGCSFLSLETCASDVAPNTRFQSISLLLIVFMSVFVSLTLPCPCRQGIVADVLVRLSFH